MLISQTFHHVNEKYNENQTVNRNKLVNKHRNLPDSAAEKNDGKESGMWTQPVTLNHMLCTPCQLIPGAISKDVTVF